MNPPPPPPKKKKKEKKIKVKLQCDLLWNKFRQTIQRLLNIPTVTQY